MTATNLHKQRRGGWGWGQLWIADCMHNTPCFRTRTGGLAGGKGYARQHGLNFFRAFGWLRSVPAGRVYAVATTAHMSTVPSDFSHLNQPAQSKAGAQTVARRGGGGTTVTGGTSKPHDNKRQHKRYAPEYADSGTLPLASSHTPQRRTPDNIYCKPAQHTDKREDIDIYIYQVYLHTSEYQPTRRSPSTTCIHPEYRYRYTPLSTKQQRHPIISRARTPIFGSKIEATRSTTSKDSPQFSDNPSPKQ